MLFKKLYNVRKDLTETRNITRSVKSTLEETGDKIDSMSKRMVTRRAHKEVILKEFRRRDIWERAAAEI